MYRDIAGKRGYFALANGTITLPQGARVLQVLVIGGSGAGTLVIFGGNSIPIPLGVVVPFRFLHALLTADAGALTIVATGTASVFVEYVESR